MTEKDLIEIIVESFRINIFEKHIHLQRKGQTVRQLLYVYPSFAKRCRLLKKVLTPPAMKG